MEPDAKANTSHSKQTAFRRNSEGSHSLGEGPVGAAKRGIIGICVQMKYIEGGAFLWS